MKIKFLSLILFLVFSFSGFVESDYTNLDQDFDLKASIKRGSTIYQTYCLTCHMAEGQGIPSVYPPLENSENLSNKVYVSNAVKNGISGVKVVKGLTYFTPMIGVNLNDKELSDVLNYIRNSWGNSFDAITPSEVNELLSTTIKKE